jgi:integrase
MAHAQTKYLDADCVDIYQEMYDVVIDLNGDCDPFPTEIETFFGQRLQLRDESGLLINRHRVINLGKDEANYPLSDRYSKYPYINYIAVMCWLDTAIERSPASLNHLSVGLEALSSLVLSNNALSSEKQFSNEISSQLTAIILANRDNQRVWMSIRQFANYGINMGFWGFNETLIFRLDEVVIPNSGTKHRVSLLDHENGPFTRSEVAQISVAIQNDNVSIKLRVLIRLAMHFGLRPIQMALLREEDIYYDPQTFVWFITIPRVKGRVAQLRREKNNFVLRQLPTELAADIESLVKNEASVELCDTDGKPLPRPLFKRKKLNEHYLSVKRLIEYSWHMNSFAITKLFGVQIKGLLAINSSYLKDETGTPLPLKITAYRFRYTLGSRMVLEGKTPEEVAIALDHSSTASVQHYFRYNRDLIDFIDDTFSSSTTLKNAVARWQGFIIDEDDDSIKGTLIRGKDLGGLGKCQKQTRCQWHPSVSCYGCSKFRPYKDADHASQLEVIEAEREFVYQNSSGTVQHQLDEAYHGAIQIVEAQKLMWKTDK